MQKPSFAIRFSALAWCAGVLGVGACGDEEPQLSSSTKNLVVQCLPADASAPAGSWVCDQPRTMECGDELPPLYVTPQSEQPCDALDAGAFDPHAVGTYAVDVTASDGSSLCETTLTIVDTKPPVLESRTLNLWPPNHKLHTITVADCVGITDACQTNLTGEFMWASSDEPVNALGDGNHEADILFDGCGQVQVRAERQGPKDGRVYKLGVRVTDAAGNTTDGSCTIVVDHDKRGVVGADSGESYRITLDGQGGLPLCDGKSDDQPPTDASTPSTDASTQPPTDASTPATDAGTPQAPVSQEPTLPMAI